MPAKTKKHPSMIRFNVRSSKIPQHTQYPIQEQTKSTWARVIESQAAVPEVYREFFERHRTDQGGFPYTVLTPPRTGYMHRAVEKLVCQINHDIHVLEKRGNTFDEQCYPITGISYLEVRAVLLDSSIKIAGVTDKGVFTSSIVYFNSINDYLFAPILKRMRNPDLDSNSVTSESEFEKFDPWMEQSFKFMNYARHSLLGKDRVLHSILQPEIRVVGMKIFGKTFYKTISPTHASILTSRELIMIREEVRYRGDAKYGGIWDYIPLNKIRDMSVCESDDNLLSLSIQLPENTLLGFLFQDSMRKDVDQLLSLAREVI